MKEKEEQRLIKLKEIEKDLYQKGFIDKQDLKKEVTIDKKEKKKSSSK